MPAVLTSSNFRIKIQLHTTFMQTNSIIH
jgi:hypothetical protein